MKHLETPKVSIITPTYNRGRFLGACIESVLKQQYQHWEMIIVDDGSTDNTVDIVSKYAEVDGRIQFIKQENKGVSNARNSALDYASGRYIAFLDSDDLYLPNALISLVTALRQAPNSVKLIYGDFVVIDKNDQIIKKIRASQSQARPLLLYQFLFPGGNPILPSASILDRYALDEIGRFNEDFESCEDLELWTRFVQKFDIGKLDQELTLYRKHEEQLTGNEGLRRYNRDRSAFQFFNSLPVDEWMPNEKSGDSIARQLSLIAQKMLKCSYPAVDTALYILRLAQRISFNNKRSQFIKNCENQAVSVLQNHFSLEHRIDIPEDINLDSVLVKSLIDLELLA